MRTRIHVFALLAFVGLELLPGRASAQSMTFETLRSFTDCVGGCHPSGPMVQSPDGYLFGLTEWSSYPNHPPTVFRLNPSTGAFSVRWVGGVYEAGAGKGMNVGDGGLVQDRNNNLYLLTMDGGDGNAGQVTKLSPSGLVMWQASIFRSWGNLREPSAYGLTLARDGSAVYGVATVGGTQGAGGIFRVSLDGTVTDVVNFPPELSLSNRPLLIDAQGRFYGVQVVDAWLSRVYRADPLSGATTILHEFSGADGSMVSGRLLEMPPTEGNDFAFVGTAAKGGTYGAGVIFRLDIAGDTPTFSKIHEFDLGSTYFGESTGAGLVRDSSGTLYGTTLGGEVFSITPAGLFSKLYGGSIIPKAPLLIGQDGRLYGTSWTSPEGVPDWGSVFRLTTVLSMTPATFDFGAYKPGTTSPNKTITLKNTGSATISIASLVSSTAEFTLSSHTCTTLLPDKTCTATLKFSPAGYGARAGVLTVTATGGGIHKVALTGVGLAIGVSPVSLNFGAAALGMDGPIQTLTVSNDPAGVATAIAGVAVTGDYGVVTNGCAGVTLAAGASCNVELRFTPTALGTRTGKATVTAGGAAFVVKLTGVGTQELVLPVTSLTFSTQRVGVASGVVMVALTNPNGVAVQLTGISTTLVDFTAAHTSHASLAPGASCVVILTFTPAAANARKGQLLVSYLGSSSPKSVTLAGNGS